MNMLKTLSEPWQEFFLEARKNNFFELDRVI